MLRQQQFGTGPRDRQMGRASLHLKDYSGLTGCRRGLGCVCCPQHTAGIQFCGSCTQRLWVTKLQKLICFSGAQKCKLVGQTDNACGRTRGQSVRLRQRPTTATHEKKTMSERGEKTKTWQGNGEKKTYVGIAWINVRDFA